MKKTIVLVCAMFTLSMTHAFAGTSMNKLNTLSSAFKSEASIKRPNLKNDLSMVYGGSDMASSQTVTRTQSYTV